MIAPFRRVDSLDGRLARFYALALTLALVAFAFVALAVLDRAQTNALDDRLYVAVRAASAFASERSHRDRPVDARAFARSIGPHVAGAIFDARGGVVNSTARDVPDVIERVAALSGGYGQGALTLDRGDDAVRVVRTRLTRSSRDFATIVLWAPLANVGDLLRRVALFFALVIPVFVVASFVLGRAIARRGLRPLRAVVALAGEIEATDLSRRLRSAARSDEIGELCRTFDRMLDRLEAAFERERRFSADASHELRAPLSILRAEAELALSRERSGDAYRAALHSIVEEADALEALTRDLLRAARTESPAPRARIDLADVAARAADAGDRLARARGVRILRDVTSAPIVGDAAALERATLALLANAIAHARRDGFVRLKLERANEVARLAIVDDGPGFTSDALRSATERFWRDRGDRAHPGTGLGLAIARTSIEASGGTLLLTNEARGGACVTMRFGH